MAKKKREWLVYVDFSGSGSVTAMAATADEAMANVRKGKFDNFEMTETNDLEPDEAELNE